MKRNVTLFIVSLFVLSAVSLNAFSQELKPCGTTEMQLSLWEQYPELWQAQQDYDQQLREQIAASAGTRDDEEVYIIPIVFHVIQIGRAHV